jgi:hypothetical protein
MSVSDPCFFFAGKMTFFLRKRGDSLPQGENNWTETLISVWFPIFLFCLWVTTLFLILSIQIEKKGESQKELLRYERMRVKGDQRSNERERDRVLQSKRIRGKREEARDDRRLLSHFCWQKVRVNFMQENPHSSHRWDESFRDERTSGK